jgi:hypothetical protein
MGHTLHNKIHTKSTSRALRVQMLALIAACTGLGLAYLIMQLVQ